MINTDQEYLDGVMKDYLISCLQTTGYDKETATKIVTILIDGSKRKETDNDGNNQGTNSGSAQ